MADPVQRYVPPAPGTSSTTDAGELQDTARQKTEELKETARGRTSELTSRTRAWMNEEADQRTTALGSQARTIADAMRETSNRLRSEGQEQPARVTEMTAERIDHMAAYLTEADGDRLMNDVGELARRQPWLFAAAGLAVGFAASRFLKASGGRTMRSSGDAYRAYESSSDPTMRMGATRTTPTATAGTTATTGVTGSYRPTGTDDV
jgi:hypothetical protein